jgi:hypothetical protein
MLRSMHAMHRTLALLASAAVVGGCGASEPGFVGTSGKPITSGMADEEHTTVVALTSGGWPFCSGTLITPTVVLTAAHCLPPHSSVPRITDIVVAYAADAFGPGAVSEVAAGWTHPDFGTAGLNHDIGLLRLTAPGPVAPIPPALEPAEQGAQVVVVGYGVTTTDGTDSGLRRRGTATVDWVGLNTLELVPFPSNICFGDSGGPTLGLDGTEERVVGIHSHVFGDCGPIGVDERVDVHADAIRAFVLEEAPTCADDHGCVADCADPDPDCACGADGVCSGPCPSGEADPDCPDLCEPDGICVDTCEAADPDCPCSEDGRCDAACDDDPDCAGSGEPCAEDGFCDEGCADDVDCTSGVAGQDGGCAIAAGHPDGDGATIVGFLALAWTLTRRTAFPRNWPIASTSAQSPTLLRRSRRRASTPNSAAQRSTYVQSMG